MMAKFKRLVMTVLCLSLSALISGENGDLGVLADLESAGNYQEPLFPAEFNFKEEQPPGSDRTKQPGEFNIQHVFNYDEDDDHWYYDPGDTEDDVRLLPAPLVPTTSNDIPSKDKVDGSNSSTSEFKSEKGVADLKEGVVNKGGLPTKKVLQAPKGTIVLYTVIIVVFIAGIVLFSVWKNPFQDGRPRHPPPVIRVGEEGKRLLDHPFV
ncbi:uncharacterized protein LOC143285517 isoform X3 [Babylonia areolata]|uniref:uncharacterized protein LOC143285517 isoform X3 n=1 Tax=Babylonia areolata TaxID=304850 RepID=UPI003FD32C1E